MNRNVPTIYDPDRDPWHRTKSPAQLAARFADTSERDRTEKLTRAQRVRHAIGGVVLAASLIVGGGVVFGELATRSIETETVLPTSNQKAASDRALAAHPEMTRPKQAQVSTEAAPSTPPTSIHIMQPGETEWGVMKEAQEQGLIDPGDLRPAVDHAAEVNGGKSGFQAGDRMIVPLDHPVNSQPPATHPN
jgi:hypothetical protein